MSTLKCRDCVWFDKEKCSEHPKDGVCRRFPEPTRVQRNTPACGEFEAGTYKEEMDKDQ